MTHAEEIDRLHQHYRSILDRTADRAHIEVLGLRPDGYTEVLQIESVGGLLRDRVQIIVRLSAK